MRNYCTLFDSKYLPQGLALYESLVRHSSEPFKLYVLPMDEECRRIMKALALPDMEVIEPQSFEDTLGMEAVKANRTFAEYCYTAASCLAEFLMLSGLPEISYIDADCWFISDPEAVFSEIGDVSIGIIPHRFAEKDKARLLPNGEFNVSLVHFKATPSGRECLQAWARACRNWCYLRNENGKYADQGYLNAWPVYYGSSCCVIQNIGAGLAPWNLGSYDLGTDSDGKLVVSHKKEWRFCEVVFYHYHEYKHGERLTNYPVSLTAEALIYKPYIAAVTAAKARIEAVQAVHLPA